MRELAGRVAVVTGGGSGIGRATALALARSGVHVVAADVDEERAAAVERELGVAGAGVRCDVTNERDLERTRDLALARFGRVDIVMNNVGVVAVGLPEDIPLAEWQHAVDVNLLSIVRSNQVFLPLLVGQGEGHVVNTASTAGLFAYTFDRLPYAATKAAVVGLSEALALYLRPRGVGVTCLCPGPVMTNLGAQIRFFGEPRSLRPPPLALLEASTVGELVVEAIRADTFLLLTHPEVREILVRRARDHEAFLAGQVAALGGDTE